MIMLTPFIETSLYIEIGDSFLYVLSHLLWIVVVNLIRFFFFFLFLKPQFKEMGGRSRPAESFKAPEQATEKKKGLVDWVNLIKPGNEEKDHWVP